MNINKWPYIRANLALEYEKRFYSTGALDSTSLSAEINKIKLQGRAGQLKLRAVVDALLYRDDITPFNLYFDMQDLTTWIGDHPEYAVLNCPNVIERWVSKGDLMDLLSSLNRMVHVYADEYSNMLIDMLEHNDNDPSRGFIRLILHKPINSKWGWQFFTPVWIGNSDSQLRQCAVNLGWEPSYLPSMMYADIQYPDDVAKWSNVQCPYSIMACKWLSDAKDGYADDGIFDVSMHAGVDPVDSLFARKIILSANLRIPYQFVGDEGLKNAPEGLDEKIDLLLTMHRIHDLMARSHLFWEGYIVDLLKPSSDEAYPLPDLAIA